MKLSLQTSLHSSHFSNICVVAASEAWSSTISRQCDAPHFDSCTPQNDEEGSVEQLSVHRQWNPHRVRRPRAVREELRHRAVGLPLQIGRVGAQGVGHVLQTTPSRVVHRAAIEWS